MILAANKVSALASLIHVLSLASSAKACGGCPKIAGWNKDNVETEQMNEPLVAGEVYRSLVFNNTVSPRTSYGGVIWNQNKRGMDTPGLKVVTDVNAVFQGFDHEPTSCIMSAGVNPLSESGTEEKRCYDEHKTGKRFKIFSSGHASGPVDLVFDIQPGQGQGSPHETYRVYGKYKNLSDKRIKSFKTELGTGIGSAFVASEENDGLAFTDRYGDKLDDLASLSNSDLAVIFPFSLFGDANASSHQIHDPDAGSAVAHHHDMDGYYDTKSRAKFELKEPSEMPEDVIETESLSQNVVELYDSTMGSWIPKKETPFAFFFDHDEDSVTEDPLVADWKGDAWQTYLLCSSPLFDILVSDGIFAPYECRESASAEPFPLSVDTINFLADSERASVGRVEDFAGVAMNFHIGLENKFVKDHDSFTLRLSPKVDDADNIVTPWLDTMPFQSDVSIDITKLRNTKCTLKVTNGGPDEVVTGQVSIKVIKNDGSVGYRKTKSISNLPVGKPKQFTVDLGPIPEDADKVTAKVEAFATADMDMDSFPL